MVLSGIKWVDVDTGTIDRHIFSDDEIYQQELEHDDMVIGPRADWGLVRVPRLESFYGLIFANWDASAPTLREYMGEYAWFLETRATPTGHGSEINGGIYKWTMDHNWKFAAD